MLSVMERERMRNVEVGSDHLPRRIFFCPILAFLADGRNIEKYPQNLALVSHDFSICPAYFFLLDIDLIITFELDSFLTSNGSSSNIASVPLFDEFFPSEVVFSSDYRKWSHAIFSLVIGVGYFDLFSSVALKRCDLLENLMGGWLVMEKNLSDLVSSSSGTFSSLITLNFALVETGSKLFNILNLRVVI